MTLDWEYGGGGKFGLPGKPFYVAEEKNLFGNQSGTTDPLVISRGLVCAAGWAEIGSLGWDVAAGGQC